MVDLLESLENFPSEQDCIKHLEKIRWGDKPTCPYCQSNKVCPHNAKNRRQNWQCWNCKKSFSVTVGIIFYRTRIPLHKWFLLIFLLNTKKVLSDFRASRYLKVPRGTVLRMMNKIQDSNLYTDKQILAEIFSFVKTYFG
jgi:transposase-like protein